MSDTRTLTGPGTAVVESSFTAVTPPAPSARKIPGKLTEEQAHALYAWCFERKVLQIGGYCGKGLAVTATAALHVWLLDNFASYPGGWSAVAGEIKATVEGARINGKVDLLFTGDPAKAMEMVSAGTSLELKRLPMDYDTVYIDADWPDRDDALDWAINHLPKGGRLIYHTDGDIRQMTV